MQEILSFFLGYLCCSLLDFEEVQGDTRTYKQTLHENGNKKDFICQILHTFFSTEKSQAPVTQGSKQVDN